MFNMVSKVNVRHSLGNMLMNEKVMCLADDARKPIYEKKLGV